MARNPKRYILVFGIIIFVLCNTLFLAYEQHTGFIALGYSVPIAWAMSVLFEMAVEILSLSISLAKSYLWKISMILVLAATLFVISDMVSGSAEDKAISKLKKPVSLQVAEANVVALSEQLKASTEALKNFNSITQRTKVISTTAELNKSGGIADRSKAAMEKLKLEEVEFKKSEVYLNSLNYAESQGNARKIAVIWNIILLQFLGSLFKRN